MEKHELTTFFSEAFKFNIYVIGIAFIGFTIYSIIIVDFSGLFTCLLLILFWYLAFMRKMRRFERITFDSKQIYIENQGFPLKEIKQIVRGKVVVEKNGKEESHYWNYFYGKNYNLLKAYHKNETEHLNK